MKAFAYRVPASCNVSLYLNYLPGCNTKLNVETYIIHAPVEPLHIRMEAKECIKLTVDMQISNMVSLQYIPVVVHNVLSFVKRHTHLVELRCGRNLTRKKTAIHFRETVNITVNQLLITFINDSLTCQCSIVY